MVGVIGRGRRLAAAVFIAGALLLAAWQPARADQVVHTVQPGENLYRIGLQYGISWLQIVEANGLTSTVIYTGQQLIIPLGGPASSPTEAATSQPAATPTPAPAPTEPPAAPAQGAASTTYTVRPGDYLSRIAQQLGVTTADLIRVNNLANPSLIYAGQVLIIPAGGQAPAAPPAASGANKQIVVDLSEQRMYVYQDGGLIWTFVVSTGEPGRATAAGTFSVLNKIDNAYGATWNIWMPNWLGIYWAGSLQNGIHALPILPGGGRLWDGYLGTRVSYGCVILGIADAQTLYDWAEVGTPVIIQY